MTWDDRRRRKNIGGKKRDLKRGNKNE